MFEYKLQIGCLLVVMYFVISYAKSGILSKMKCNVYYDVILGISPWAILFDGITAWTVNHRDIVPEGLNLFFHCMFFLLMNALVVLVFVYTVDQSIGINNKLFGAGLFVPGIISTIMICANIGQLYYVSGKTTAYSMGISVITCYISLLLHAFSVIVMLLVHYRTVERKKLLDICFFFILLLAVLIAQATLPEVLLSSLFPTLAVIGIYISFENPSLKHLHEHNDEMVSGFATLVESRDNSTGGHIKRTRGYVSIILKQMKRDTKYRRLLTEDYIQSVRKAAPMHDIGKISTPDSILQKPAKLTAEEFEIMKQHAPVGGEIIKQTFCDVDTPEYQKIAYEVARFHHEKWNGNGYPDGLKGAEIPLHARIMAIADVFDAVSAKRCYRDALPIEECFSIIKNGAEIDFDPDLVRIFMSAKDEVLAYYEAEKDL